MISQIGNITKIFTVTMMSKFKLAWPEGHFSEVVKALHDSKYCIYGKGTQDGTSYHISARVVHDKEMSDVTKPFLTVPTYYGGSLEHLCYLIHYFWLSWKWMVDFNQGKTTDWGSGYDLAAETIARSLKYHLDAFGHVVREVRNYRKSHGSLPPRIKTLGEWMIRRKLELEEAGIEKLMEARNDGYFAKDILNDADFFGTCLFSRHG